MKIIQILGNKTAGFILGLFVVGNFILGSLVMNFNPDIYPPFFPFNLNFFFNPLKPVHFWLYLLILVLFIFGMNLLACSIDSFVRLIKNRAGRISRIGALCAHVAVLLALVAHLYEGFGMEDAQTWINSFGIDLKNIGFTRLISLKNEIYPDGSLKDTLAEIEISVPGKTISREISYNSPAIFDLGSREIIIQKGSFQPVSVILLNRENQKIELKINEPVKIKNETLILRKIGWTQTNIPYALITWRVDREESQVMIALSKEMEAYSRFEIAEDVLTFEDTITEPVLLAMIRYNPAIQIIIVSVVMITISLLLLLKPSEN